MKKITNIILITILLFTFQGCSVDDEEVFKEDVKLIEELTQVITEAKNSDSFSIEICQVLFTFHDPDITASEKLAIRKWYHYNHFTIYDYTVSDHTMGSDHKEIWFVNCREFESYLQDNAHCGTDGCLSCTRDGCNSSGPKPKDPPEDPLENNN
ncbi:hypothetical protein [uncultured Aquimarina sp.]|uniref:hypothetical protein n=1 Tax=uncultured Aquimarina sp. TaxID=575652 RepID=UPI00260D773E|nr:hypothetical protein [uncultured Aquimarina sp.]